MQGPLNASIGGMSCRASRALFGRCMKPLGVAWGIAFTCFSTSIVSATISTVGTIDLLKPPSPSYACFITCVQHCKWMLPFFAWRLGWSSDDLGSKYRITNRLVLMVRVWWYGHCGCHLRTMNKVCNNTTTLMREDELQKEKNLIS